MIYLLTPQTKPLLDFTFMDVCSAQPSVRDSGSARWGRDAPTVPGASVVGSFDGECGPLHGCHCFSLPVGGH